MLIEKLNANRLAEAIDAFNDRGFAGLDRFLSDDIVWHVGGTHPLSGIYRGRDAVADYHRRVRELCDEKIHLEASEIIAGRTHVAVFLKATGRRDGRVLEVTLAEAIALDQDGRWTEYRALSDEQDKIDAFWHDAAPVLDLDARPDDASERRLAAAVGE